MRKTFSGVFLLILMAVIGLGLIWLPGWVIDNYQVANSLGSVWGVLYLIAVGAGAALILGSGGWTIWKLFGASIAKKRRTDRRGKNPSELSTSQQQFEIDENLDQIDKLANEVGDDGELRHQLNPLIQDLEQKREAQTLEIVAFGTISSGKSSVLNLLSGRQVFSTDARGGTTVTRNEIPWPGIDSVILVDTPGIGEIDGADHVHIAAESAKDADIVLVVVDGPLRQSEHDLLAQLGEMEKRAVICLNKSDWYSQSDRDKLVNQIFDQTGSFVRKEDIVCIQAQSGSRTRKRILADGREVEDVVEIQPNIDPLAVRMTEIVKKDGKDLLLANLLLQSRGLIEKARDRVKDALDKKAWAIVEKYQWGAGGVAAVSPFPVVDLLAGSAISTKMILDLAEVYQQKVDIETASKWLGEMGKNLVGVLGAQGATVAVSAVVASIVKTIPFAGTVAGGVLQGAVQALITRWIGMVFIEYFRSEMQTPEGGLAGLARRKWNIVTSADELRKLLQTARERLSD
jgi:small GTP-binding protein